MRMNEKKSFLLYCDYREHIKLLSVEEKAALLDAIFDYASGEKVEVEGAVGMAFSFITAQMERDAIKWEAERQARSEAGKKGMASRWGNRNKEITNDNSVISVITDNNKDNKALQDITSITVNDNVNVNDTVINNNSPINYQEIVSLYNSICKSLPEVKRISDPRKRAIKARLKTYSIEDLEKAFRLAEESDFISGRSGKWTGANFDWLMKEANLIKVLEGNYKNNKTSRIEINPEFRRFQEEHELVHFNVN